VNPTARREHVQEADGDGVGRGLVGGGRVIDVDEGLRDLLDVETNQVGRCGLLDAGEEVDRTGTGLGGRCSPPRSVASTPRAGASVGHELRDPFLAANANGCRRARQPLVAATPSA